MSKTTAGTPGWWSVVCCVAPCPRSPRLPWARPRPCRLRELDLHTVTRDVGYRGANGLQTRRPPPPVGGASGYQTTRESLRLPATRDVRASRACRAAAFIYFIASRIKDGQGLLGPSRCTSLLLGCTVPVSFMCRLGLGAIGSGIHESAAGRRVMLGTHGVGCRLKGLGLSALRAEGLGFELQLAARHARGKHTHLTN